MSGFFRTFAAASGTTGNNTHTGVKSTPAAGRLCVAFVIEAVGATPTITFKIQGAMDADDVTDGNAGWFDLPFLSDTTDTVAATLTKTAVGSYPMWLSQANSRFVRRVRVVTSANTNVTYRAELSQQFTI